jgi:serine protease Do
VADVTEESPAAKAGIQRGDVIVEFAGKKVSDPAELRNIVAATSPGQQVPIKMLREGKQKTVTVTVAELPATMQKASGSFDNLLKGVQVQDLTPEIRNKMNIPKRTSGVMVTDIASGSAADGVLGQGDVLMEINKHKINSIKDYEKVVSKIKSGEDILLLIFRNGSAIYMTLSAQ